MPSAPEPIRKRTALAVLVLFTAQTFCGSSAFAFSSNTNPIRVAVLEYHQNPSLRKTTSKMSDLVRNDLSNNHSLDVLSKKQTESLFELFKGNQEPEIAYQKELIAEAKSAYFRMDLDAASHKIQWSIEKLLEEAPTQRSYTQLKEAYLVQAMIVIAQKDSAAAKTALEAALVIDPNLNVDSNYYPPKLVKVYNQIKKERSSLTHGALGVSSFPPASEVFLNDSLQGITPLSLGSLPTGNYTLTVKTASYKEKRQIIKISPDETTKINLRLKRLPRQRVKKGFLGYRKQDYASVPEIIQAASEFGRFVQVDKVVLISSDENAFFNTTGRIISPSLATSHKPQSILSQNLPKQSDEVARMLAIDLSAEMNRNIMKAPTQIADDPSIGRPILMGQARPRFYERKLFWVAMGLLASGGLATGLSLSQMDGSQNTSSAAINFK